MYVKRHAVRRLLDEDTGELTGDVSHRSKRTRRRPRRRRSDEYRAQGEQLIWLNYDGVPDAALVASASPARDSQAPHIAPDHGLRLGPRRGGSVHFISHAPSLSQIFRIVSSRLRLGAQRGSPAAAFGRLP